MAGQFQTIHVDASQSEKTLAAVLKQQLSQSWTNVKRLISSRRVQLNGNVVLDAERRLTTGDVLRVSDQPLVAPVTADSVRLVHVDPHVVVVDKPAGVTTLRHAEEKEWSARRKNVEPTLEEWIVRKLREASGDKPTSHRRESRPKLTVRAVHRLDRDTSGLIVFARTPEAETELIRQFKKHTTDRAYIAIAIGRVEARTINTFLVRDRGDGLRGGTNDPHATDAQQAITHVKPLEYLHGYTVVECRLETGRTHQIRIHLSEQGNMLCGEKVYVRDQQGKLFDDSSHAPRQMLHAALLGFEHPHTKQRLQFVSPLPNDMLKVLERLRKHI